MAARIWPITFNSPALSVPLNSANRNVSNEKLHFEQKKGSSTTMTCDSFTLHGTGTWTGKWWFSMLRYVLDTLHSDRTGTGNHCFLLYPSRSRVQVPCSVYNPLHIFLTDFLSITNFISVTIKSLIKTRNTTHGSHFSGLTKFPDFTSIFSHVFSSNNNWSFFYKKRCLQTRPKALLALSNCKRWHRN